VNDSLVIDSALSFPSTIPKASAFGTAGGGFGSYFNPFFRAGRCTVTSGTAFYLKTAWKKPHSGFLFFRKANFDLLFVWG
jgi:hypothetical protein